MRQKDQKLRYSDTELALMKSVFAGDDTNLYAVRKHMLGLPMTEGETKAVKGFNKDVKALLGKVFMPQIDGDAPLFQLVDMQMALREEIKGKSKEEAQPIIEAKRLEMAFIEQRIQSLHGNVPTDPILLEELADFSYDDAFIRIQARNYLLSYVDSFINELRVLAGQREDTVEETLKKLNKDSNK